MAALSAARSAIARLLRVYAQLFFSRSPAVGALLFAATALDPYASAGGVLAVVAAVASARLLGVDREEAWTGPYGVNALLVGLGIAHTFTPGALTFGVVVLGAMATVVIVAALSSLLVRTAALPVLSSPFLVGYPVLIAVAGRAGLVHDGWVATPAPVPAAVALPLEALGAILFLPRADAGALVLVALLVHSRIASLFAASSLAVVWGLLHAAPAAVDPALRLSSGLNAMITAIALGSVWFVPSGACLVLAIAGGVLSLVLTAGLSGPLARLGIPVLITPFYVSVALVLLATRQRALDASPKSVDFVPGTPEENLRHYLTQRARFASLHPVAFHLPFRGAWTCTQGVDGPHTHQGPWRHAFDFEVRGDDGSLSSHGGATPEDHHCHRLPVLATADGTVVSVENDVPDNAVGELELERNWGNLVLLCHAPGLYSLVAHLATGSVRVAPGQLVKRGAVLGLCGSSGRSPRPHLHFQLQGAAVLGAPTLPCRFADAVRVADDGEHLLRELSPDEGDTVRGIEPEEDVAACLALPVAAKQTARHAGGDETLTTEVDLYGRHVLRGAGGAVLYFGRTAEGFVAQDAFGPSSSVVHLLRVALARVPFEARVPLSWTDLVPSRWHGGLVRRTLRDFVAPFVAREGLEMRYALTREAGHVVVTGASVSRDRKGAPILATRAVLSPGTGIVSVEVKRAGKTTRATFAAPPRTGDAAAPAHPEPWRRWAVPRNAIAATKERGGQCSIEA